MMLTGLADVLRTAHLDVVEVSGWKTRGHGPMADVLGVTCHHTASGRGTGVVLGLSTVLNGRSDLPGPLAHLYLNRSGTFYVVAAGLTYHAGESRRPEYTNSHRIGIEALAAGDGWSQDWPSEQMAAYALGCKALADHYGFAITEVRGHLETCAPVGRKIDPHGFSMNTFRQMVKDAEMINDTDLDKIEARVKRVVTTVPVRNLPQEGAEEGAPFDGLDDVLAFVDRKLDTNSVRVQALQTAVDSLTAELAARPTLDQIVAALKPST